MREHDIRTVLSEGGQTDADEAIRRAAEDAVHAIVNGLFPAKYHIELVREHARSITREHIAPLLAAKDAEIAALKAEEARLLCPPHRQLDDSGGLEPFDNCIACIRSERDELRKEVAAHLKAIVYQCHLREESERERDEWKRKAEAAERMARDFESELERHATDRVNQRRYIADLERQLAEVTALYDKYGEHIQGCSAYVEMYSCDCGFIEANASREKGGAE